ncbi:MAG: hypothetical protein NC078_10965, partial [Ruminococcus sp.]|nr:hypothetical protein [Ruminococcus sp.]
EFVLRIFTGQEDLIVTSNETQYDLKHLQGARSICFDVLATDSKGRCSSATDSKGRWHNLEVQRSEPTA